MAQVFRKTCSSSRSQIQSFSPSRKSSWGFGATSLVQSVEVLASSQVWEVQFSGSLLESCELTLSSFIAFCIK